jgi:hypothetical protein
VDRAVDSPCSQGPTTTRSGAYVEEENAASGAKTKRGALTSSGLRGNTSDQASAGRGCFAWLVDAYTRAMMSITK